MNSENKEFFENNTFKINQLVTKILILLNLLAPICAILSYFKIFQIEKSFILFSESIIFPFSVITLILVYGFNSPTYKKNHPKTYERIQSLAKYFGLLGASYVIAFLGAHANIGIYIGYGLVVFLSCLYYDVKLTLVLSVTNYIGMIFSQYGKALNRFKEGIVFSTSPTCRLHCIFSWFYN